VGKESSSTLVGLTNAHSYVEWCSVKFARLERKAARELYLLSIVVGCVDVCALCRKHVNNLNLVMPGGQLELSAMEIGTMVKGY